MEDSLSLVFSYLDVPNWKNTKLVCRQWRRIGNKVFDPSQVTIVITSLESLRFLLQDKRSNIKKYYYTDIVLDFEVVKLLLSKEDFDPHNVLFYEHSGETYNLLWHATEKENIDVVKLLLQDKRVDPTKEESFVVDIATSKGNLDLIKLFELDGRVDFTDYMFLITAASGGYIEIVKFLQNYIKDEYGYLEAFLEAAYRGHLEIVRHLNIYKEYNSALQGASTKGHIKVVKFLLENGADPNYFNLPLRLAACEGHVEVVKLLLENGADPSDNNSNNEAIYDAAKNGHIEVVKVLLEDERVDPNFYSYLPLREALQREHIEIARLLASKI